ncbi:MAG TPA: MBL fold metallo-hydrolase [Candidatus Saccharimonadia bacterium]
MKISKFGHSCVLIEEGKARILLDPGAFSSGFEGLEQLDAILITHSHPDHFVPENLKQLLAHNPQAQVIADETSAAELAKAGRTPVRAAHDGDAFEVAGVSVRVRGTEHAQIHPKLPTIPNVGYFVADRFFYPGDNFTQPGEPVEILGLPLGAPWSKVSEVIDYTLAVRPQIAIPMHDAVLAMPDMHINLVNGFAKPENIELRVVANGSSTEV